MFRRSLETVRDIVEEIETCALLNGIDGRDPGTVGLPGMGHIGEDIGTTLGVGHVAGGVEGALHQALVEMTLEGSALYQDSS